jgi:glycosyltransferase involved in cell wall biosynthesis/MoaA/NifB/PqqE/SkfB family radical SAM enzyme
MNVCVVTREIYPLYYGGIGTQFFAIMDLLKRHGHTVIFITEKPTQFDEQIFQHHYAGTNVYFVDHREKDYSLHTNLLYAHQVEQCLYRVCQDWCINVIILADCSAEGFGILYKRLTLSQYDRIPIVMTINGPMTEVLRYNRQPYDLHAQITCEMENVAIELADWYIAPSAAIWQEVQTRLSLPEQRHIVIPNLIDVARFPIQPPKLNSLTPPKRIIYVGRLEHRKGVDCLLEAFLHLFQEHPNLDAELIFAGTDQYWADYQATFIEHWTPLIPEHMRAHIRFQGFVDHSELAAMLHGAWVGVFPSRWEPFGIAALEAITSGTPVIVTQATGLQEIVGKEYEAVFDLQQGTKQLKEVLWRVLNDEPWRDQLAQQVHARARALAETTEGMYLQFLHQCMQHPVSTTPVCSPTILKSLDVIFASYRKLELSGTSQLQENLQKLHHLYQEKTQHYVHLEQQHQQLQHHYQTLSHAHDESQKTIHGLQQAHEESQKTIHGLQQAHEESQKTIHGLQQAHEESQPILQALREDYDSLQQSKTFQLASKLEHYPRIFALISNGYTLVEHVAKTLHQQTSKLRATTTPLPSSHAVPTQCTLFMTDRCNFRCTGCSRAVLGVRTFRDMEVTTVQKLLSIYPSIQAFCVAGLGEPTLSSHFTSILNALMAQGKYIGLITNGTNIEPILELQHDPGYISISLYGYDEESYIRHTQVNMFEKIITNYAILRERFEQVGFSYILTTENYHQLPKILAFCDTLHPSFLNLVNYLVYDPTNNSELHKIISVADLDIIQFIEHTCQDKEYLRTKPIYLDSDTREFGCKSYMYLINLDGDGNIGGCQRQIPPSEEFGNVFRDRDPFNTDTVQNIRNGIHRNAYPHQNCHFCFGKMR